MSLIIPPGFMQVVWRMELTGDDEEMLCTCGFDLENFTGTSVEAVTTVSALFATWIMGFASNNLVHTYATGYIGQDGADPLVADGDDQNQAGGDASETLPNNCAYMVRKRTDLSGRRGRGRFYVPSPDETQVDRNGAIASGWVTTVQANLDDFYDDLTTGSVLGPTPPVVLHRSEGEGVEPAPTPITSFQLDNRIATQRRRMRP